MLLADKATRYPHALAVLYVLEVDLVSSQHSTAMLKHELFERLVVTIHAITMPALLFSIPLLEAGGGHLFGTLSPLSK